MNARRIFLDDETTLPSDYFGGSNFEIEAKLGGKQADKRGKTDEARGARWLAGLGGRVNSNSIHGGLASLTRGHQRLRCGNRCFGPGLEKRASLAYEKVVEYIRSSLLYIRFFLKTPLHLNVLLKEYTEAVIKKITVLLSSSYSFIDLDEERERSYRWKEGWILLLPRGYNMKKRG